MVWRYIVFNKDFTEKFFADKEKFFVVCVFFDYILKKNELPNVMQLFAKGIGYSDDYLGCYFPSIFENKEEDGYFEDGVMFFFNEEEVWIEEEMFIKCLELAEEIYLEKHYSSEEKEEINLCIEQIKCKH